jgi:hypothetical protein
MNIFFLHPNPRKAARWHLDKHVVKMILESVQMLYTAHWVLCYPELLTCKSPVAVSCLQKTLAAPPVFLTAPTSGYRPVHVHHPCTVWVRTTRGNYRWLALLALELCREFRFRYEHEHSCFIHAKWLYENPPSALLGMNQTIAAIAMDPKYRINKNPVCCYRNFYRKSKVEERGLGKYTKRHEPHWLSGEKK